MKKIMAVLLAGLMCLSLCSCGSKNNKENDGNGGIKVVVSVFAPYDFARAVVGDKGDVEMLVPVGSESHYFEPSFESISKIASADLFIYVGDSIDTWAPSVLETVKDSGVEVLRLVDYVNLLEEENIVPDSHAHTHKHTADEHIWTSPKNAAIMTEKISEKLSEIDGANAEYYKKNKEDYVNLLDKLDRDFKQTESTRSKDTLVFADRFAYRYLAQDYNINCFAAFSGCGSDTEPTLAAIRSLTVKINDLKLPAVIVTETSKGSVAEKIAKDTGAKILTLHSCHNVSAKEFKDGVTYIELMNENLRVLKEALECR